MLLLLLLFVLLKAPAIYRIVCAGVRKQLLYEARQGTEGTIMFLTEDQLSELTGFIRPSKQIEWLQREGFEFRVAADGHPRVLRDHVFRLMGVTDIAAKRKTAPDFTSVRKVA